MYSRIKISPFIKVYVSVNHRIIYTGLQNLTPILISIQMMVHSFFNARIELKEQNQLYNNGIDFLM